MSFQEIRATHNVVPIRVPVADMGEPERMLDLVQGVRRRSGAALEELYRLVVDIATPQLRWHLGNPGVLAEFDDHLHDVFLAVLEAVQVGAIREPQRLVAFVRTIVRYQTVSAIRQAIRGRRGCEASETTGLADLRPTPERSHMEREQREVLGDVLRALRPEDSDILRRFYLDGQNQQQICKEMHLTSTQFRLHKSRAKGRLAALALGRLGQAVRTKPTPPPPIIRRQA